jgi:hypothetical protein
MPEPLSEAVRMQVGQCLNTAGQTAACACWLLEHDDGYSASSLLTDIAAIEAALRRARQSIPAPTGSAGD